MLVSTRRVKFITTTKPNSRYFNLKMVIFFKICRNGRDNKTRQNSYQITSEKSSTSYLGQKFINRLNRIIFSQPEKYVVFPNQLNQLKNRFITITKFYRDVFYPPLEISTTTTTLFIEKDTNFAIPKQPEVEELTKSTTRKGAPLICPTQAKECL